VTPSVAVVGAGAIGAWIADALDRAGWAVSMLARGSTLAALRADGLRVERGGETRHSRPRPGGIDAQISRRIRHEVWANMNMNPLSALTRSGTARMLADADVRELCIRMMEEMQARSRKSFTAPCAVSALTKSR
jgi:ketopantoate reductase